MDGLFRNENISKAIEISMKYRQITAFPLNEYMK